MRRPALRAVRHLAATVAGLCVLGLLSACGQKGPLTLPPAAKPVAAAASAPAAPPARP